MWNLKCVDRMGDLFSIYFNVSSCAWTFLQELFAYLRFHGNRGTEKRERIFLWALLVVSGKKQDNNSTTWYQSTYLHSGKKCYEKWPGHVISNLAVQFVEPYSYNSRCTPASISLQYLLRKRAKDICCPLHHENPRLEWKKNRCFESQFWTSSSTGTVGNFWINGTF